MTSMKKKDGCSTTGTELPVTCNLLIKTVEIDNSYPRNTHTHTHVHYNIHLPLGVSRNPAAEDNRCSCSSSLSGGL